MPRVSLAEYPAERILLLKPSALGDIVHALPVLAALRQRYPQAQITWLVNAAYRVLLEGNPDLNAVFPFERKPFRSGFVSGLSHLYELTADLRRGEFDLVVDLQGLLRSGLMTGWTGAQRRVGLRQAREGSRTFYTDLVDAPQTLHAVDRCWRVAEAFGVGHLPKRFFVPVQSQARVWLAERLRGVPRPWVVVAPGARWQTKRWPPEHFAQLIQRTHGLVGGTSLLIGAREERSITQEVMRNLPTRAAVDLAGQTTLAQLVAILAAADLVFANDSGPLHLATALGKPVVAPYTCTRVERHGPYGLRLGPIATRVDCHGSYQRICSHQSCMDELTPERVAPVLGEVLFRWQSTCRSA